MLGTAFAWSGPQAGRPATRWFFGRRESTGRPAPYRCSLDGTRCSRDGMHGREPLVPCCAPGAVRSTESPPTTPGRTGDAPSHQVPTTRPDLRILSPRTLAAMAARRGHLVRLLRLGW